MNIYASLAPTPLDAVSDLMGAGYTQRMMHKIPDATVVDREKFILEQCKGKRVLNLGCASGTLHGKIKEVAAALIGVDKAGDADYKCDLDRFDTERESDDFRDAIEPVRPEMIIAGEIFEHLSNPGNLLRELYHFHVPMIITVPNAFTVVGLKWMKRGYENVNEDHVAWYSYSTMKQLVSRYGFAIKEFHWYNGEPLTAEGMAFLVE